jgi:hypothetical protein
VGMIIIVGFGEMDAVPHPARLVPVSSTARSALGEPRTRRQSHSPFSALSWPPRRPWSSTHIPQFESALLDIQYCSFYLFYRLVAIPRSTGKRTYDLFLGTYI